MIILSGPRSSNHNRARANMGAVENLDRSIKPRSTPSQSVCLHVGPRHQFLKPHAAAKIDNVAAPSVVATEKCAISEGEKANRASAKLAAPRENNLSAARQTSHASKRPSRTFIARARP